jgi:hypothetical protein
MTETVAMYEELARNMPRRVMMELAPKATADPSPRRIPNIVASWHTFKTRGRKKEELEG